MFARWLACYQHHSQHQHQVFITASATLKEQVSRTFRKLQAAAIADPADARAVAAAAARDYPSLRDVPSAAFPLFVTTAQWLRMLDASCDVPFFAGPGGEGEDREDADGIGLHVELGGWDSEEEGGSGEGGEEEEEEEEGEEGPAGSDRGSEGGGGDEGEEGAARDAGAAHAPALRGMEVRFEEFVGRDMWAAVTRGLSKEERSALKAPLVYQEITSYIKGSAEALEAGGRLSLAEYLEVIGRKRAANYGDALRRSVYRCFEAYERVKAQRRAWDRCDMVAHIYRQLCAGAYQGVRIDGVSRDEVQDFTQAELLLDVRLADPNALFYCGDTCQTIARGVGFRFEDVRTLLYNEGKRREAAGAKGPPVGMPRLDVLRVNYRTHSGILDAASSDLSILLSSGDEAASQIEFGAQQVVLVRDMAAVERLPDELRASNALIMSVAQSKGLEFSDVDFFADSPAQSEWSVLLTLLSEIESGVMQAPPGASFTPHDLEGDENKRERGWLRAVAFDPAAHTLLCNELKLL
ncbi:hypothetical protein MNEG_5936 [Monoraphidium neglectum]|uniref:UvrD-like helicase ATP-binding domain-containing protein n=1 Tax=Monoraphidium neglectum TaxID=145388 RepID=A0A0D2L4G5_9CHLO|nr:hypothetical protein MNEG_5936 [Monoraphidium neglectum]KIZ02024.1 hypothetical protein MNEG_5936 [Monoraphidium neglectum]|eukprot:XP_013901043.1 hypothetical protein MNEG_5936 [Monoraphidium neglectum]